MISGIRRQSEPGVLAIIHVKPVFHDEHEHRTITLFGFRLPLSQRFPPGQSVIIGQRHDARQIRLIDNPVLQRVAPDADHLGDLGVAFTVPPGPDYPVKQAALRIFGFRVRRLAMGHSLNMCKRGNRELSTNF